MLTKTGNHTNRHTRRPPANPTHDHNLRKNSNPKMQHSGSQPESFEPLPPTIGSFLNGPQIKPLHQWANYDMEVIAKYIGTVLNQIRRNNSYGILVSVQVGRGALVPTLVFGFPGQAVDGAILPPSPYNLPRLVFVDSIVSINQFSTLWATTPVRDVPQITLEEVSVGIEGSLTLL